MPLWLLVPVLVVLGFGLGVGQPMTMSWLAESAPPGLRGRAMSLRLVGNRTGQLLLPGAAGLVAAGTGAAGVLMITALGLGWAAWPPAACPWTADHRCRLRPPPARGRLTTAAAFARHPPGNGRPPPPGPEEGQRAVVRPSVVRAVARCGSACPASFSAASRVSS
ncbi:MFS transporter [Nonomuraea thailandensis]